MNSLQNLWWTEHELFLNLHDEEIFSAVVVADYVLLIKNSFSGSKLQFSHARIQSVNWGGGGAYSYIQVSSD